MERAAVHTHAMGDDDNPTTEKQKLKRTKPLCLDELGFQLEF